MQERAAGLSSPLKMGTHFLAKAKIKKKYVNTYSTNLNPIHIRDIYKIDCKDLGHFRGFIWLDFNGYVDFILTFKEKLVHTRVKTAELFVTFLCSVSAM